jgi:hypothetical protein
MVLLAAAADEHSSIHHHHHHHHHYGARIFCHNTLQRLAPVAHETRLGRLDPIVTWHSPPQKKPIYRRGKNPRRRRRRRRGTKGARSGRSLSAGRDPRSGSSRVSAPTPRLLPRSPPDREKDGDSGGGGGGGGGSGFGRWAVRREVVGGWWGGGAGGCAGVGAPPLLGLGWLLFSLSLLAPPAPLSSSRRFVGLI